MTKVCRRCSQKKNIEDFPLFSGQQTGRKNTCSTCCNDLSVLRKRLKQENPPPPAGECPICQNLTHDWILDHCHFTNEFRGYICNNCNLALGRFNDDERLLRRAIDYLNNNGKSWLLVFGRVLKLVDRFDLKSNVRRTCGFKSHHD